MGFNIDLSKVESRGKLVKIIEKLKASLSEREEILKAIQNREIDALVINGPKGKEILTLDGADVTYKYLIDELTQGAITLVGDDTILYCNKGFASILNTRVEKVIGTKLLSYVDEREVERFEDLLDIFDDNTSKKAGLFTLIRPEGELVRVLVSITRMDVGNTPALCVILKDVTLQKERERIIKEQSYLLDNASDAIFVLDLNETIIYMNLRASNLYKIRQEEAYGRQFGILFYEDEFLFELLRVKKSLMHNNFWKGELHQINKQGKPFLVESRWNIIHDEGKPHSILVINSDITVKRKLEMQIAQAKKLESLSMFVGGIAHNLNNLLTTITLSCSNLRDVKDKNLKEKLIEIIDKNAMRGANLIKNIMLFSGKNEGCSDWQQLDVKEIIRYISEIIENTFPENINMEINLPDKLPLINGNRAQINQALMNISINAKDAMPSGGVLNFIVSEVEITEFSRFLNYNAKPGKYIVISVSDTGNGIPADNEDKIFTPFFTTKEIGKGIGLGLASVRGIMKRHNGFVNYETKVGDGTVFHLYFPAIDGDYKLLSKSITLNNQYTNNSKKHILVLEPGSSVRNIINNYLHSEGYYVTLAKNLTEANAFYSRNHDEIEVIIMDVNLNQEQQKEFTKRAYATNPDVKIIGSSDLSNNINELINYNFQAFLLKPYTKAALLSTIKEVLLN